MTAQEIHDEVFKPEDEIKKLQSVIDQTLNLIRICAEDDDFVEMHRKIYRESVAKLDEYRDKYPEYFI